MTEIPPEITRMQIATILSRYRFEMRGYSPQELLDRWLPTYSLNWIRMAILEALYQGRYKVISVEEILKLWHRRGQPTFHFTHDFERLVCKNLSDQGREGALSPVPPAGKPRVRLNESIEDPWSENNDQLDRDALEATPTALSPLAPPLFNDPRQTMSKIEDLFSHWTAIPATVPPPIEEPKENRSNGSTDRHSIHQFVPLLDGSELYSKLKAVARSNDGDRACGLSDTGNNGPMARTDGGNGGRFKSRCD